MKPDIDLLLAKYFGGEASAEELAMLDDWLALSAENEVYFDELTKVYEKSGMTPPLVVNEDKALDLFEKHIHSEQEVTHVRSLFHSPIFYAAASIALLIGIFSAILFNTGNKQITITTELAYNIPHTISNGIVVTPDSSTTIAYKAKSNNLIVTIEGKASFNITDNDKKLLVSAGETFIEDIGTIFTVTAYPESNNITVLVESGSVRFYTNNDEGIFVNSNEKAIYRTDEKRFELIVEEDINVRQPIRFNAELIENVINTVANYYNVEINLSGNANEIALLTVSFSGHETIDEVLEIIAETLSLQLDSNTGIYTLSN